MEKTILNEINKLVSQGNDEGIKKMGGYIVIGAFAYISPHIKDIYSDFIFD